jgi:hypothetical protein
MSVGGTHSERTPGLREAAILVWHHQRTGDGREAWEAMLETEAQQSRRVERFSAGLRRIVGERDDISFRVNGGCVEADVEGLQFAGLEVTGSKEREGQTLVTLLGRCPSCGALTMSEPFDTIGGLGKMLEKFEPISEHFCLSQGYFRR